MQVLVTGATGFLGTHVVRALLARGDRVRCLVRTPNALLDGLDLELVQAPLVPRDKDEQEDLLRAVDGCEGIFHIAGAFDVGPQGHRAMRDVHVFAARALCDAGARTGARRLVLCSSSITVGYGSLEHPGDENSPLDPTAAYGPSGPLRWYHDTKKQGEQLVLGWPGLETVVVNPDYVVGAFDIKPTSGQLILAMARHPVPFWPKGGKCFIDAGDCAQAHLQALDRGTPGRRYLLGNHNLRYRAFMSVIAEVTGQRPPFAPLPDTLLRLAARVGAIAKRAQPHRFAGMDRQVLLSMQQPRYRSGARARQELGMPATPLHDSVEAAWRWFREQGRC